jgi:ATP-dependent Zn protease
LNTPPAAESRFDAADVVRIRDWRPSAWRRARDDAGRSTRAVHESGHVVYAATAFGLASLERVSLGTNVTAATTTLAPAFLAGSFADPRLDDPWLGMALAGLVAEEVMFDADDRSQGCGDDLDRAVRILLHRGSEIGYSRLWAADLAHEMIFSPGLEQAISRGLREAHARAMSVIQPRRRAASAIADRLLSSKRGELAGDALRAVVAEYLPAPLE